MMFLIQRNILLYTTIILFNFMSEVTEFAIL